MNTIDLGLRGSALTHTGHVRPNNEDAFFFDLAHGLFAVADGMGGHKGGEVAAQMAVERLEAVKASVPDERFISDGSVEGRQEILDWMSDTIQDINLRIHTRARKDRGLYGMGSTLDLILFRKGGVFIGHAGDTRCYMLREGALYQLTEDHTLGNALKARGMMTEEQVARHPQRDALTHALGLSSTLEVDTSYFEIGKGDVFLVCSDGLYDGVKPEDMRDVLTSLQPEQAPGVLVKAALNAGGRDNITTVVVAIDSLTNQQPLIVGSEMANDAMAASGLFAQFTEGELLRMQKMAVGRQFKIGENLVEQRQICGFLMLPIKGDATVWVDGQCIGHIGVGDPVGDLGLVPDPSLVTVRAETPMIVLEFPLEQIHGLLGTDTRIAAKLSFAALQRLSSRITGLATALARYRKVYGPTPP